MAASGLIYATLTNGDVLWLVVRRGEVVDATQHLKPRIVGACPRRAWQELSRQATRIEWIPDDRRQRPVTRVPRRAAVAALDRLRRAHERVPRTAVA